MARGKQKSILGEIGSFVGLSFAGIGVAFIAAVALYLIGLGKTLIPGWVGYACIPLLATALYVAVAKRDWRGLAFGLVFLVPALFNLGMAEAAGARELSRDPNKFLAHALNELMGVMAVGCPLAVGLGAIMIPLLLPRQRAQSRR